MVNTQPKSTSDLSLTCIQRACREVMHWSKFSKCLQSEDHLQSSQKPSNILPLLGVSFGMVGEMEVPFLISPKLSGSVRDLLKENGGKWGERERIVIVSNPIALHHEMFF